MLYILTVVVGLGSRTEAVMSVLEKATGHTGNAVFQEMSCLVRFTGSFEALASLWNKIVEAGADDVRGKIKPLDVSPINQIRALRIFWGLDLKAAGSLAYALGVSGDDRYLPTCKVCGEKVQPHGIVQMPDGRPSTTYSKCPNGHGLLDGAV